MRIALPLDHQRCRPCGCTDGVPGGQKPLTDGGHISSFEVLYSPPSRRRRTPAVSRLFETQKNPPCSGVGTAVRGVLGSARRVCWPALRPINQKKSRFWFPYPRFGVASPVTPPRHATFSSERENARSLGGAPGGACRKSLTPRSEVARWHHGRFRRDSVIRPGSPVNAQARKLLSNGIRPSP